VLCLSSLRTSEVSLGENGWMAFGSCRVQQLDSLASSASRAFVVCLTHTRGLVSTLFCTRSDGQRKCRLRGGEAASHRGGVCACVVSMARRGRCGVLLCCTWWQQPQKTLSGRNSSTCRGGPEMDLGAFLALPCLALDGSAARLCWHLRHSASWCFPMATGMCLGYICRGRRGE
jgi:hypothetical protein